MAEDQCKREREILYKTLNYKLFLLPFSLTKLHRNVWKSLNTLEKFIFNEWKFDNKRALALSKAMSPVDQKIFYIDISTLNWIEYFEQSVLGVREFLNKESHKSLPAARRKDKL